MVSVACLSSCLVEEEEEDDDLKEKQGKGLQWELQCVVEQSSKNGV